MSRFRMFMAAVSLAAAASPAFAAFHLFRIVEVYSNGDGTVQYVMLREMSGANGENFWLGQKLETTDGSGVKKQLTFPSNLPSSSTANRNVLVGTVGLAAAGVQPDFVIPDRFVPTGGGRVDYASGVDEITIPALPTDGATAVTRNGTPTQARPTNFAGNSVTLSASPPPPTTPDLNQHGLTGSWFEPATSGQGIELEVYPDHAAPGAAAYQGAWFTYDVAPPGGADHQRWYTFAGNGQSGATSVAVTIFRNIGGNFNAPPTTGATPVGSGTLSFTDCSNATFAYTLTDGSGRQGSIALTRLTPNVTCTVGTTPTTNADFAFSGNWFDAATSGQGFVFDVNPLAPVLFLTWYTYAPAGQPAGVAGQRWFTGQSTSFAPGARNVAVTLYETTGGAFDQASTPAPATVAVGTGTVSLASCGAAQLQFNFTGGSSAGRSGTIGLTRVGPTPPGCVASSAPLGTAPPPAACYYPPC